MCAAPPIANSQASVAPPVLVELFTSEGCSSCPPADALLEKLDQSQSASGAHIIVLSEHVDYWDNDGWKDAYSSSVLTDRQRAYQHRFNLNDVYTPQMVVDGEIQFLGSDSHRLIGAIGNAQRIVPLPVSLSSVSKDNQHLAMHVQVDALPQSSKPHKANIYAVVALDHAETQVRGGENKGRQIDHVGVVESIEKIGAVEKGRSFQRDVQLKIKPSISSAKLRVIVFVQEPDMGKVLGATMNVVSPQRLKCGRQARPRPS